MFTHPHEECGDGCCWIGAQLVEPVATRKELLRADAKAIAATSEEALIRKAGYALAQGVRKLAGKTAGLRVVVLAGPGLNGADGKVAAKVLERFGAKVTVVELGSVSALPPCDVLVDAAIGTGLTRAFLPPTVHGTPLVVACDVPSGLSGDTGEVFGHPIRADLTVTFGATKPGLLFGLGRALAGEVIVAPLDLDLEPECWRVTNDDVANLPKLSTERHKWTVAVGVIAGSPGMEGAANFVAAAAFRAGAGMVRVATTANELPMAREAVLMNRPTKGWPALSRTFFDRCGALVVGPGISREPSLVTELTSFITTTTQPLILDADALVLLSAHGLLARTIAARGDGAPVVLLPHDGEFEAMMGRAPGSDRLGAARQLAQATGATVLLKGPTTVVADAKSSDVFVIDGAPSNLATAGSGDVLAGICGALLARPSNWPVAKTVAHGARLHAMAGARGVGVGLLSSELPRHVAEILSEEVTHGR